MTESGRAQAGSHASQTTRARGDVTRPTTAHRTKTHPTTLADPTHPSHPTTVADPTHSTHPTAVAHPTHPTTAAPTTAAPTRFGRRIKRRTGDDGRHGGQ